MEEASLDNNWFYEGDGEKKGPITEKEIGELIRSGTVSTKSHVWKQGFTDWKSVDETELNVYVDKSVPPPLSGDRVNNAIVWVIAFMPIIGSIIENFLSRLLRINLDKLWFVTLLLNIILCVLDERSLKKAGHDTSKYNGWIWLIPVYLFQRAKYLKQNMAYFAVWIACFLLCFFI